MKPGKTFYIFIITLILSINVPALASEEGNAGDAAWLDDVPQSFGNIEFLWELNRDGDESFFDSRYYDGYRNDDFRLEDLNMFYLMEGASFFDVRAFHNWYTRGHEFFEYRDPLTWRLDARNRDTRFFEIPSLVESKRNEHEINLGIGGNDGQNLKITYASKDKSDNFADGTSFDTLWDSDDFGVSYDFNVSDWDVGVNYYQRELNGDLPQIDDVSHATWSLNAGRELCNNSFFSGNMAYTTSEVQYHDDLTSFAIGGSGRFINPLGIDRMVLSCGVNWLNRDDSVGYLHPLGDRFNINARARYRVTDNIKLHAGLDLNRHETSYPDRNAIEEVKDTLGEIPLIVGEIEENTMWTNRAKFGGDIALSENVDLSADWKIVRRRGMEATNFGFDSSHLIWDKEFMQDYALRYKYGRGRFTGFGTWEIKYTGNDRTLSPRDLSDDTTHFTINWAGFLNENFYTYVGGGYLKTSLKAMDVQEDNQKGKEYGGGFDWSMNDRVNFYFDYWNYDISGNDGFDQVNYLLGLKCKAGRNWTLGLEYEKIDDEFDDLIDLNGETELLNLVLNYEW